AHTTRLERRGGVEAFVLHPETRDADLARQLGQLLQRGQTFAQRDGRLVVLERHDRRIAPHVPAGCDDVPWRHGRIVDDEKGLSALGADGRPRVTRFSGAAGRTFEMPDAHDGSVVGIGDDSRSAATIRSAVLLPKPGSAAIASTDASRTPCKLPNASSNTRRLASPMPGTFISSDVTVRIERRLRWKVIAKRCASSRAC